jgi:hypothetical protein
MTNEEIDEAVARKLGLEIYPQTFIPHYSRSIAAAWDVVEKLFRDGMCIQINIAGNEKMVGCRIGDKYQSKENGEADTAPMAICLAFLELP